ncbi:MAG: hypothetical protein U0R65_02090 [Candidatus Nanopelagicales bacterium]
MPDHRPARRTGRRVRADPGSAVLAVIRDTVATGYPRPSAESASVGLTSPSSVAHAVLLERMGYVHRDPNRPRALVVADPDAGEAAPRPSRRLTAVPPMPSRPARRTCRRRPDRGR